MENGRYVPGEFSGFAQVTGAQELAQRILMKLTARRGGFPLRPEYGSRLYLLPKEKPSQRPAAARQLVTEALAEELDVSLEDVSVSQAGQAIELKLRFLAQGGEFELSTLIGGDEDERA